MEEKNYLAKWINNELSEKELVEFKNTTEFKDYEKIKEYSSHLQVDDFDEDTVLKSIMSHKKTDTKIIPLYKKWFVKVAAVLVLGLGITVLMQNASRETQYASHGQKTSFSLPDKSEVVLNAESEINYKTNNWDKHRSLELKGEAYFKVAKGKSFVVTTSLGKITVLGTQFNVKSRNNRLDVSCFEGKVKVNYKNQEICITKGQAISYENGNPIEIPKSDITEPEWMHNELAFKKERIDNIISELNRHYNVTIILKDQPSAQLFTGTMPANKLDDILHILASAYHLRINKINKNSLNKGK